MSDENDDIKSDDIKIDDFENEKKDGIPWKSVFLVIIGLIAIVALVGLILSITGYATGFTNPKPNIILFNSAPNSTNYTLNGNVLNGVPNILYVSGQVSDINTILNEGFTTNFATITVGNLNQTSSIGSNGYIYTNIYKNVNRTLRIVNRGLFGKDSNNLYGQAFLRIKTGSTSNFPFIADGSASKPSTVSAVDIAPGNFADFTITPGSVLLNFIGSSQMDIFH